MTEENNASENVEEQSEEPQINVEKYNSLMLELKAQENIFLAIFAGITSALVGAAIWAAVTVITGYQIGWMAVGVGFLVGFAVKILGKGMSTPFGIVGAVCALFGCAVGNFLTIVAYIGESEAVGYFEVLSTLDYAIVPDLMATTFSPMDILFYGLAIYEGYKFSFRQISEEELQKIID